MTEKVICPWCGAEMEITTSRIYNSTECFAWMWCAKCNARSPMVGGMEGIKETEKAARAAALRRYTPPMRPMTWDEVAAMPEMCWYERVEGIEYPILPMAVHGGALKFAIRNGTNYAHTEGYNRTWRCWSRKPTEEERKAAEWD